MDVSGQFHGSAALPPKKQHPVPFEYETGRAPELGWALSKAVKSCRS
jgi:hypothetical protein